MKVLLLAGGLGTRMREETEFKPKPMVEVGGKPVLWHIMKHFATYGHTEFIICTGYKGEQVREYFLNYESRNLDFTLSLGGEHEIVYHGDHGEHDWRVTVLDTGSETPTGGRLLRAAEFLGPGPFFVTYGDGIADVNLDELLRTHRTSGRKATLTTTNPRSRFGVVEIGRKSEVVSFLEKPETSEEVSIGFFVFDQSVFELLRPDSTLETEPLQRLAESDNLSAYRHRGFWQPMDTYREMLLLNNLWESGAPWKSWS